MLKEALFSYDDEAKGDEFDLHSCWSSIFRVAAVKYSRELLIRTVGKVLLNGEEMEKFLAQFEVVLISRLLVTVKNNPNDVETQTPEHLLI